VDDAAEIIVLQLPKFRVDATELLGSEGIEALAAHWPIVPMPGT